MYILSQLSDVVPGFGWFGDTHGYRGNSKHCLILQHNRRAAGVSVYSETKQTHLVVVS